MAHWHVTPVVTEYASDHIFTVFVNFLSQSQNTRGNEDTKKKGLFGFTVLDVSGETGGCGARPGPSH